MFQGLLLLLKAKVVSDFCSQTSPYKIGNLICNPRGRVKREGMCNTKENVVCLTVQVQRTTRSHATRVQELAENYTVKSYGHHTNDTIVFAGTSK